MKPNLPFIFSIKPQTSLSNNTTTYNQDSATAVTQEVMNICLSVPLCSDLRQTNNPLSIISQDGFEFSGFSIIQSNLSEETSNSQPQIFTLRVPDMKNVRVHQIYIWNQQSNCITFKGQAFAPNSVSQLIESCKQQGQAQKKFSSLVSFDKSQAIFSQISNYQIQRIAEGSKLQ